MLCFLLILTPVFAEEVNATTIFLTSDNVLGYDEDMQMLNDIKSLIEEKSNNTITCVVDSSASSPGEGSRAMVSKADVAVMFAYACAGNFLDIANYATKSNKKLIYVNTGATDLYDIDLLRRAYDDNWSNYKFACVKKPAYFLIDSGITVLQPTQKYPDETDDKKLSYNSNEINEYLADEIIEEVNNKSNSKVLKTDLVGYHKISPNIVGKTSNDIINNHEEDMAENYGEYSTPQSLYLLSSYVYGQPLAKPSIYEAPNDPWTYSYFNKNSYTIKDYMSMAKMVVKYMDENKQAPDFIIYDGAVISYYDLIYNFALISKNTTDNKEDMTLPRISEFKKYYSSILFTILPFVLIILIILAVVGILIFGWKRFGF